jgi:hypothetical protein
MLKFSVNYAKVAKLGILTEFEKFASSLTFAKAWMHKFMGGVICSNI